MDIVSNKEEMIFRSDVKDKTFYRIGLSKKKQDGTYEKGYMNVSFKKGVELNNMTKIKIKMAWLDFYKIENKTIPTIFINDFEVVEEGIKEEKKEEKNPFEQFAEKVEFDFGEEIKIEESDLPF